MFPRRRCLQHQTHIRDINQSDGVMTRGCLCVVSFQKKPSAARADGSLTPSRGCLHFMIIFYTPIIIAIHRSSDVGPHEVQQEPGLPLFDPRRCGDLMRSSRFWEFISREQPECAHPQDCSPQQLVTMPASTKPEIDSGFSFELNAAGGIRLEDRPVSSSTSSRDFTYRRSVFAGIVLVCRRLATRKSRSLIPFLLAVRIIALVTEHENSHP